MTQVATPPQTLKPSAEGEGWKARPIRLKIFGNLITEVVKKGICMYCGACIASCPIDILFHSDNEEPIMRGTCAACQVCYYSCPRIELPVAEIERRVFGRERTAEEAILGVHIGSYSVRAKDPEIVANAQDGGAVSALMLYALEKKIIDYALVSGFTSREPWKPAPKVARTRKELIDNAGSEYTPGGQIGGMAEIAVPNRSVVNFQEERLALVGLPCELQGFWRMNTHWIAAPKLGRNLVFTIGLFCSKVFDYQKMMVDYVQGTRGIDLGTVTKVNIKKNRLLVYSAELSDIAVGAIGSAAGWSTVLTRTPRGEDILNGAVESGYLEMKRLDPAGKAIRFLETLCERKRLRDPSAYIRHSTAFARPEPKLVPLEVPAK